MHQFNKKNQRIKMKELTKQEDIIITNDNKDNAFVIIDVKDFIKEAEWQMNKTNNYKRLHENVTTANIKLLKYT